MAGRKFRYNPETCRFEPVFVEGRELARRMFRFLLISLTLAVGAFTYTVHHFESIDEMTLREKNANLKISWNGLTRQADAAASRLAELIRKDDQNYRVILDLQPLSPSIRRAGIGGSEKVQLGIIGEFSDLVALHRSVDKLQHQAEVQLQSFEELSARMNERLESWSSRPAIQPLSNDDLKTLHMTYGLRLHPIFNVWKEHKGLDFAADEGTPVYATGDGTVKMAYLSESFGNVVYIDHGFEFQSRYAHLSRFAVTSGQSVRRGQVIGYVGNTGNSVAPHLHYEILVSGIQVNPLNFFQRDLSAPEYQRLIDLAEESAISLD